MKLARRFFFLSATLFHNDKKAATPRLFLLLSVSTVFCSLSLLTVSLFPWGTRGTLMTELEREKIPQHVSSKKSPLSKKKYSFKCREMLHSVYLACSLFYYSTAVGTRSKCHRSTPSNQQLRLCSAFPWLLLLL